MESASSGPTEDGLAGLIEDLWLRIFGHMSQSELAALALVCKMWREWTFLLTRETIHVDLRHSNCPISSVIPYIERRRDFWKRLTLRSCFTDRQAHDSFDHAINKESQTGQHRSALEILGGAYNGVVPSVEVYKAGPEPLADASQLSLPRLRTLEFCLGGKASLMTQVVQHPSLTRLESLTVFGAHDAVEKPRHGPGYTIKNNRPLVFPLQGITIGGLQELSLHDLDHVSPTLIAFVMQLERLKRLTLNDIEEDFNENIDWSSLAAHPSLVELNVMFEDVDVIADELTVDPPQNLLALPQLASLACQLYSADHVDSTYDFFTGVCTSNVHTLVIKLNGLDWQLHFPLAHIAASSRLRYVYFECRHECSLSFDLSTEDCRLLQTKQLLDSKRVSLCIARVYTSSVGTPTQPREVWSSQDSEILDRLGFTFGDKTHLHGRASWAGLNCSMPSLGEYPRMKDLCSHKSIDTPHLDELI